MFLKYPFFKSLLSQVLVLTSLFVCLGNGACNQCKSANATATDSEQDPSQEKSNKLSLQIIPLGPVALTKEPIKFQFRIQQEGDEPKIDLSKLTLKITAKAALLKGGAFKMSYNPINQAAEEIHFSSPIKSQEYDVYNAVLAGEQVGVNQDVELTLLPAYTNTKADITLQLIYEQEPLEGENSTADFTWRPDIQEKLFQAIFSFHSKEDVFSLIESGKGIIPANATSHQKDLLLAAILSPGMSESDRVEIIKQLQSVLGIKLNTKPTDFENSPVGQTIREGYLDTFKLLLREGAEPSSPKTTALHIAVAMSKTTIINYILNESGYSALKDAQDVDGNTPLHIAAAKGLSVYVKLLVARGANRDKLNNAGETPMDALLARCPAEFQASTSLALASN